MTKKVAVGNWEVVVKAVIDEGEGNWLHMSMKYTRFSLYFEFCQFGGVCLNSA